MDKSEIKGFIAKRCAKELKTATWSIWVSACPP